METNEKYVGTGVMKPVDADARVKITVTADESLTVTDAVFEATGGGRLADCASVLCEQVKGRDVRDFFQMNNNVIYYNIEPDLTLSELWQASVAVLAAKRAAAEICRKNGIEYDAGSCCCV